MGSERGREEAEFASGRLSPGSALPARATEVEGAARGPGPETLLSLQRAAGNAAVAGLVERLSRGQAPATGELAEAAPREEEELVLAGERASAGAVQLAPQYRPGTPVGDSLFAHELGHALHRAAGALGRPVAPRHTTGEAATVPSRTRGLALQRCARGTPRLRKRTVAGPTTSPCGGFSWGAQWYLDNAGSTDGFVVQHVQVAFDVKDAANRPVDVKAKSGGLIDPAWWPLWEAWQVRGGNVYVGTSTTRHSADTYSMPALGSGTKGTITITGSADYYPGLTLPSGFTVRNAPPAGGLPVTNTDPNLSGGTGVLAHNLTATWDCTPGSSSTATTVTTT